MSRLVLGRRGSDTSSLAMPSTREGVPIRQTRLAPNGVSEQLLPVPIRAVLYVQTPDVVVSEVIVISPIEHAIHVPT